jgi:hypothetical protein
VFVPVATVGRVTVAVVDVVNVVAVLDRLVPASLPVLVGVVIVDRVCGDLALVPMAVMESMSVTVVEVVGVVAVLHGDMATALAVLVRMVLVESMFCHGPRIPYDCIDAQS